MSSHTPDPEALLVALALAPGLWSRNRFFQLFESREISRARRRASSLRSLIAELTEPWPRRKGEAPRPPVVDIREVPKGDEIEVSFTVPEFEYRRTVLLTRLERATLSYALSLCDRGEVSAEERTLVEGALARAGQEALQAARPKSPPCTDESDNPIEKP